MAAPRASAAIGQNGDAQTYPQVTCSAKVGSATISQKQDLTVWAIAPDAVEPGETFTVNLPSIAADLPTSAQGLQITSYRDLKTTYRISGATVLANSGTNDGPAYINGNSTPAATNVTATDIAPTVPGPIPPGHLVPPNSFAQIVAPVSGQITISAIEVTTTARVNGSTDAVATCPVPANTLTHTDVDQSSTTSAAPTTVGGPTTTSTAPTTTTTAGSTTTTVPSGGNSDALQCAIAGSIIVSPALKTTSTAATKDMTFHVTPKGTLTACTGGPPGLSASVTNGTFSSPGVFTKVLAGQPRPTCDDLEHASLARRSTSKLMNGTTTVASISGPATFGPMITDAPVTFNVVGTISTRGPFKGKPIEVHAVTSVNRASWTAMCASTKGLAKLPFGAPSTYLVGTPAPPSTTTTTTVVPTTTTAPTTTVAPTTTTAPTTTVAPTTTTTPTNPIPPAVQQAILTACNTLGAAAQTLGVDITPLVTGCQLVVGGEGSFLLQLFLQSPSLGCAVMAGVPIVNNPLLSSACVVFAAALQPYSSMIAGLIPQALFDAV